MKKDKIFLPIFNSRKYIKAYLYFLALGIPMSFAGIYYDIMKYSYDDNYNRIYRDNINLETVGIAFIGFVFIPISVSLFMKLFNFLYFTPLEEHKEWVVSNGIFSDLKDHEDDDSTGIMGRDKLSSFSVADELIKWNDLLEKELISQEDFDKAKQKLLNQK